MQPNHNSWRRARSVLVPAAVLLAAAGACKPVGEKLKEGIKLSIAADTSTDVARIRFTVEQIPCGGETITPVMFTADRDLENGPLTTNVPDIGVDPASQHRFADWFVSLSPGCYRA